MYFIRLRQLYLTNCSEYAVFLINREVNALYKHQGVEESSLHVVFKIGRLFRMCINHLSKYGDRNTIITCSLRLNVRVQEYRR